MINIRGVLDQMKAGREPWPIRQTVGQKSVYSAAINGGFGTGLPATTNAIGFSLFSPSTYAKKITLLSVTVSFHSGAGGTYIVGLNHIRTDPNTGKTPTIPAKHDQTDPTSGAILRVAGGGSLYIPPDVVYQTVLVQGGATGQFTFDFRQPNEGKPITLNPLVGEGVQFFTTVLAVMSSQATVSAYLTWMEE